MDKRIEACFDHLDYHFYERTYSKDDIMINPIKKNKEIIFVVEGTIAVYAILQDGSMRFVSMNSDFCMLGDIEFVIGGYPTYFVEAKSEVKTVCLSLEKDGEKLHKDLTFIHYVMNNLVDKLQKSSTIEIITPSIEERLLTMIKNHDHTLTNIEEAAFNLHCSKRQLQRVLKKLVEDNTLIKVKKGVYKLK